MSKYQDGLFWEFKPKTKAHVPIPPDPVWLRDDYLPNLDKAKAFVDTLENDYTIPLSEPLTFDIELYPNYFLICFKSVISGKLMHFELHEHQPLDVSTIKFIIDRYLIISFNGNKYDLPILALALEGYSIKEMKKASDEIIVEQIQPYMVLRQRKVKQLRPNHIDLIELSPLTGSLKIYGARLNTKTIQDLPFPPNKELTKDQMTIIKWYCFNDLQNTEDIYNFLKKNIELREMMGAQYNLELRSKSDAQVAEAVISSEMTSLNGVKPERTSVDLDTSYKYDPPDYLNFKTTLLQNAYNVITSQRFYLAGEGAIQLPQAVKDLKLTIGATTYQVGIGGLHSTEKQKAWLADDNCFLIDRDVVSYYPFIILNNELYPEHLGTNFLTVYRKLVDGRIADKKEMQAIAKEIKLLEKDDPRLAELRQRHSVLNSNQNSKKVSINGSFGKLGNKWSVLYSPKLLIQVTLTGQLSLLYLIEKIEGAGISCVSANTDGVVIKCPHARRAELDAIVREWEQETNFETEETAYLCLACRSVNDYMALKTDLKTKGKGKLGRGINAMFKNPDNFICITAIEQWLSKGIPVDTTINSCQDLTEFLTVRTVKGGGVKDGEYLGKVVRWYYSEDTDTPIVYSKSGNKVPKSEGAKPVMELPDSMPPDLDFKHYIRETKKMIDEMGLIY